ncbi:MAG: hypothetical protein LUI08_06695 [Prevotella sp.]|nr:hypothetical protein [Prevotella sp.]MCD8305069.1 hypothetical protein [Prevotella sp.]
MNEKLQSHFLSLYSMVMADGIVHANELETLYRIGRENYGLSQEDIDKFVLSAGTSFVVPEDFSEKVRILYELAEIAWADGEIDDTEVKLLERYVKRFGFLDENAGEISKWLLAQVHNGVTFDDTLKEIEESQNE